MPVVGPRLHWGRLSTWIGAPINSLPRPVRAAITYASGSLDLTVQPVEAFHLEGTLNIDPDHQASDRAKKSFPQIFDMAICARLAAPALSHACLAKVSLLLLAWARTYKPTGNPINEVYFVPLLQSIDLVAGVLSPNDRQALMDWTELFARRGDQFFASKPAKATIWNNNWMSARLLIRALVGRITGDGKLEKTTRDMLAAFTDRNFVRNQSGLPDGTTFDFIQRDALLYHVGDLISLVQIVLFTPEIVPQKSNDRIHEGILFLKPFYTGAKTHIEFLHTSINFDVQRRLEDRGNPAFQNKNWSPVQAGPLLTLARLVYPDIASWTNRNVSGVDDDRIKLLSKCY